MRIKPAAIVYILYYNILVYNIDIKYETSPIRFNNTKLTFVYLWFYVLCSLFLCLYLYYGYVCVREYFVFAKPPLTPPPPHSTFSPIVLLTQQLISTKIHKTFTFTNCVSSYSGCNSLFHLFENAIRKKDGP